MNNKININEIAQMIKEKYNLTQTPTITQVKIRSPVGKTTYHELGIGSTLTVYYDD